MEQSSLITEWVNPEKLIAHPLNIKIYGEDNYEDLIESIKDIGIIQAIYVNEKNIIISGHRRWQAAKAANLNSVPIIRQKYSNYLDERRAIIEHNRYRIKNGLQLYNEGLEIKKIEAEKAKERERLGRENFPYPEQLGRTRDKVAEVIGLGSGKQWDKLEFIAINKPDELPKIKPHGLSIRRAYINAYEEKERQNNFNSLKDKQIKYANSKKCQIFNGDFLVLCSKPDTVSPDSIDAIVTDPPWTKTTMHEYSRLAQVAKTIVKPGGLVVAMVGTGYMPEAIELMGEYLTYWWTMAYMLPGENGKTWSSRTINLWKPVLVFVKDKYDGHLFRDAVYSERREKKFHAWQSSESGFKAIIEELTEVGDLILDPFMGSGTTGVAALSVKRRYIGIEMDIEAFNIAQARLTKNDIA